MSVREALRFRLRRVARRFLRGARGSGGHRRFLSDSVARREQWLQAAREYVSRKPEKEQLWLYRKPYDPSSGHPEFFHDTYSVLNLLKAMAVPPGGRILEVGSGPGWISEILLCLGFEVEGIEPSEEMIAIARERIDAAIRHHRLRSPPAVRFHASTIEDCDLPDETADAVLFHASLHHVVDEDLTLAQCFRLLRPGGVIGVCEAAWIPGQKELEAQLEEEMRQYGTLENPFTPEYLDSLLDRHGFVDLCRYHAVNGYFPARQGRLRLDEVTESHAHTHNNLTARKPSPYPLTTLDPQARTLAEITVLSHSFDPEDGRLGLRVRLDNRGETAWLERSPRVGWVSIALRAGDLGSPGFREAARHRLPETVPAGGRIEVDLVYSLPPGSEDEPWHLDLINEELFWFSQRGTRPARIELS